MKLEVRIASLTGMNIANGRLAIVHQQSYNLQVALGAAESSINTCEKNISEEINTIYYILMCQLLPLLHLCDSTRPLGPSETRPFHSAAAAAVALLGAGVCCSHIWPFCLLFS